MAQGYQQYKHDSTGVQIHNKEFQVLDCTYVVQSCWNSL